MDRLIALCHRRWMIPILAQLYRSSGSKFFTLRQRLGASEGAIRQSLQGLMDHGFAARNPGYGHPLRPEYILVGEGIEVAQCAATVAALIEERQLGEVLFRKWSLPCLLACREGGRYSDIKARLTGVTDRALSKTLRELEQHEVVGRTILDTYPPTTVYQVRSDWLPLASHLNGLVP